VEKITMSVKEMGAYLGISTGKAYELVKTEGFPIVRVGRKVLISKSGLIRWIEKGGQNLANE